MFQTRHRRLTLAALGLAVWGAALLSGGTVEAQEPAEFDVEERTWLSPAELEELVGPIALYPDDLVSIVLPASTHPLQVVQAARYLERHEREPALKPDDDWDDSIVALLNYPEVVDLMNADLDWTWELGRAVLYQRSELMDAIQAFRRRAHAAGNLETDDHQVVIEYEETIIIERADPTVIYVPYYEPERVVIYHSYPVYHYYPRAYPVYYYPYPHGHWFGSGFFWGVVLAFSVDWHSHHVHAHHHHHKAHPYHGHDYHYSSYRQHSVTVSYSKNIWRPGHKSGSRQHHVASVHPGNKALGTTSASKGKHYKKSGKRIHVPGPKQAKRSTEAAKAAHAPKYRTLDRRAERKFRQRRVEDAGTVAGNSRHLGRSKLALNRPSSNAGKRPRGNSNRTPTAGPYAGFAPTRSSGGSSGRGSARKKRDRSSLAFSGNVSKPRGAAGRVPQKLSKKKNRSSRAFSGNVSAPRGAAGRVTRDLRKKPDRSSLASSGNVSKPRGAAGRVSRDLRKKKDRSSRALSGDGSPRRGAVGRVSRHGYKKKDRSGLTASRSPASRQQGSRRASQKTAATRSSASRGTSSLRSADRGSFQSIARSRMNGRRSSRAGGLSTGMRRF